MPNAMARIHNSWGHTWFTGEPVALDVLMEANNFDFSQDHTTRFHSGAPPWAARTLLSELKAMLVISCKPA